jgi:hypothetical protein
LSNSCAEVCLWPNFRNANVAVVGYRLPIITDVQGNSGTRCQGQRRRQVDLEIAKIVIADIQINYDISTISVVASIIVIDRNVNPRVEVMLLPPVINASKADRLT